MKAKDNQSHEKMTFMRKTTQKDPYKLCKCKDHRVIDYKAKIH